MSFISGLAIYHLRTFSVHNTYVKCNPGMSPFRNCFALHVCHFDADHPPPVIPDIRLTGGETNNTGRLEVKYGGVLGTVCYKGVHWGQREANVACKQLLGTGQAAGFGVYTKFV